jgi:methylated-DNA-[protein]-cysteine S-methyltransferase
VSLCSLVVASPVGDLVVVASESGVRAVLWPEDDPGRAGLEGVPPSGDSTHLLRCAEELAGYFAGTRTSFEVTLDLRGTEFQLGVWRALRQVGYAERVSYRELAAAVGRPTAARAVGAAVGRNPVSVVLPCHRVVGADGSLTGFAGGLAAKTWLLGHELQVQAGRTAATS